MRRNATHPHLPAARPHSRARSHRGIPDGYGWERFFGLGPSPQLEETTQLYRYDTVFVLDPLDSLEDPDAIVWAKDREIRRVHELIVQDYSDAGYEPVFVPARGRRGPGGPHLRELAAAQAAQGAVTRCAPRVGLSASHTTVEAVVPA
ncbi:MAG: AAA family ATPase [Egibacteraceae bacterium]